MDEFDEDVRGDVVGVVQNVLHKGAEVVSVDDRVLEVECRQCLYQIGDRVCGVIGLLLGDLAIQIRLLSQKMQRILLRHGTRLEGSNVVDRDSIHTHQEGEHTLPFFCKQLRGKTAVVIAIIILAGAVAVTSCRRSRESICVCLESVIGADLGVISNGCRRDDCVVALRGAEREDIRHELKGNIPADGDVGA